MYLLLPSSLAPDTSAPGAQEAFLALAFQPNARLRAGVACHLGNGPTSLSTCLSCLMATTAVALLLWRCGQRRVQARLSEPNPCFPDWEGLAWCLRSREEGLERVSKVSQATGPALRARGAARLFRGSGARSHGENLGSDSE